MKFQSAQDVIEVFVYVATSQGGPRGNTDTICTVLATSGSSFDNSKKQDPRSYEAEDDEEEVSDAVMFNLYGGHLLPYAQDAEGEDVVLYNAVDLSNEDVQIFQADISSILTRQFDARERLALLVYGTVGMTHAAHVLSGKTRYLDLKDYWDQLDGFKLPTSPGGYHKRLMWGIVRRFEDAIVEADYMGKHMVSVQMPIGEPLLASAS